MIFFLTRLLPSWVVMATFLTLLREWIGVSNSLPLVIWMLWVAKDIALIPRIRSLDRIQPKTGLDGLIGQIGVTRSLLEPTGYVFLRGELWRAEAAPQDLPLPSGIEVRVEKVHGLTLLVRRASSEPA